MSLRNRRGRRSIIAGATVVLLCLAGVTRADAATPASGTVSPASPTGTWTAGPFAVANPSAQSGSLLCNQAAPCDDYGLTVTVPAGYDAGNDLTISVGWPDTAADFDVYLYDSAGTEIGRSASSADPETMVVPPVAGRYTVRVVPFAPLGQSYSASARLAAKPVGPPPRPVGAGAFT